MTLIEKLEEIRQKEGLTIAKMADLMKVTRVTYSYVKNGQRG